MGLAPAIGPAAGSAESRGAFVLLAACATVLLLAQCDALPTPQAPIEYRTVQVQAGISLDVAVAGPVDAKDAMVLLHGYPECSWFWRGVVDPLLKGGGLQLWMPDQRGFNHSSKPDGIGR
jgi:pimeloyl-ACP methyl ester carboxylesterase